MLILPIGSDRIASFIAAAVASGLIGAAEAQRLLTGEAAVLVAGDDPVRVLQDAARQAARPRGRPSSVGDEAMEKAAEAVRAGASLRAAAREAGVPRSSLSARIGAHGTPGRKPVLSPDQIAQARAWRQEGWSYRRIADALEAGETTVKRALGAAG